ncbi:MAG: DHH family phosphoesterase [Candidatus Woesearchaeota archaeon]|nr:DHH family phosphoesterase [Candidatus Woesearchaeota archaeon]
MTNTQVIQRAENFLKTISKKDKVAIIHDTDPDGVCAAVITAKCIERLRGKKIELHIPLEKEEYGITKRMIQQMNKYKINKLIALDFSTDQNLPLLKKLEKQMHILNIDHHKLYNNYQSDKTTLYKPQLFTTIEPSTYCTAKLAYDLASRVTNVSDLDWMAAAACIADIATTPWKKWLAQVFKKHKSPIKRELFKTKLGKVAVIMSSTEVYDVRLIPECYEIVYKAKKPRDIFKSKLKKYNKIIDDELNKHFKLFKTKAKRRGELYIYEMISKYRVHSPISTLLALKNPHKTIIIINKTNKIIAVSARREDSKIAVNKILENAIKGFKGANAGGHTPAAGAGFNKKYLKTFKERIWKSEQD